MLALVVVILAFTVSSEVRSAGQGIEDLARRQYDSGLSFVQNGRYAEALKDFQAVVDSFPQSAAADDALLAAAETDALLTENGPSVKELATAKLAELQKTVR